MFTAIATWVHGRKFAVMGVLAALALAWHETDKRLYAKRKTRELKRDVEDALESANEQAREQVETIRIETNERIERAEQARNTVTSTASASELPDAGQRRYFGKRTTDQ